MDNIVTLKMMSMADMSILHILFHSNHCQDAACHVETKRGCQYLSMFHTEFKPLIIFSLLQCSQFLDMQLPLQCSIT